MFPLLSNSEDIFVCLNLSALISQIFRTDLISAMKLPDHQNLSPDNYMTISDPWRQEWERGVQVTASRLSVGTFRLEYEIEYEYDFSNLVCMLLVTKCDTTHM